MLVAGRGMGAGAWGVGEEVEVGERSQPLTPPSLPPTLQHKTTEASPPIASGDEGLQRWDVTFMDYGNTGVSTVT